MTQEKEVPTFSNLDSMSELIHDALSPVASRKAFEAIALKQPFIKDVQRYDDDDRRYKGAYGHCDTKNAKVIWDEAVKWVLETLNDRGTDLSIKGAPALSFLANGSRSPVSVQNDLADRGISSSQLRAYGIKPDEGDGIPQSNAKEKTIHVVIAGRTATGKSSLAFLIEQLLDQHEIPNVWTDGATEKNMNQMSFRNSLELLRSMGTNVVIEERHLARPIDTSDYGGLKIERPVLSYPPVMRAFPKRYGDPISYVWDILVDGTNRRPGISCGQLYDESEYHFTLSTIEEAMRFKKDSQPRLGVRLTNSMPRMVAVVVINKQTSDILGIVNADESKSSGQWPIVGKGTKLEVKSSQHYMRPATDEELATALKMDLEQVRANLDHAKPKPGQKYHTRPMDTLPRIAREAYGDADYWTLIYEANCLRNHKRPETGRNDVPFADIVQPHDVPIGLLWIPPVDQTQ